MTDHEKRTYNSKSRKLQAKKTRSQILEAAKKLFQKEGFDRVTIGKIAETAKVSNPTIYAIFKSKRGILSTLIDEALPPEHFSALVEEVKREKSAKIRLEIAAKMACQIYDAEKEVVDLFRSAPLLSPELKELETEREKRRYERQKETVERLVKENTLKEKLTLTEARDILWSLTGRELYRMFVIERKWTSKQYENWLGKQLKNALIKPQIET